MVYVPLRDLETGAKRLSSGNLEQLIPVRSGDEFGQLAASFNAMTLALGKSEMESREWSHTLEQKVRERTQELRVAEAEAARREKLASVGLLAAGIAHELNNPLTGILTFSHLVRKKMPDESPEAEDLDLVIRETKKCASIIRRLLDFGREKVPEKKFADLNQIIEDTARIVEQPAHLRDIEITMDLDRDLPPVWVDADLIEQVIMNICVNARDAMPQGGTLVLETRNIVAGKPSCVSEVDLESGNYAVLSITDDGIGMDDRTIERIFDPFFTTKEVGKGTGLGLSMAYGIMRRHNGRICVLSKPGKGSTFELYFPMAQPEAAEKGKTGDEAGAAHNGGRTILLAEDERLVRQTILRILEQSGYTILTAQNGEDALRVFEANKDRIVLAILDMMMPKKGGFEVSKAIRALRPDTKILIISGYGIEAMDETVKTDPTINFLMKPFRTIEVARKVSSVLGSKG